MQKSREGMHVSLYVLREHVNFTIGMYYLLQKIITFHKSSKTKTYQI